MSLLATQQSALLQVLFTRPSPASSQNAMHLIAVQANKTLARGLKSYQSNAESLAIRSLQAVYPVLEQLIGEEAFSMLARDLWCHSPPLRGDLAQWGFELAAFVTSIPQLAGIAFLPDVARTEWALHTAASASDPAANLPTLALLTQHEPERLTLTLAPGTALVSSLYPVASIVTAHLYASPPLAALSLQLHDPTPQTALIWRHGLRPTVADCPAGAAIFVQRLLAGASLLAALEFATDADAAAPFDFNQWLPHAAQNGLLLGARLIL